MCALKRIWSPNARGNALMKYILGLYAIMRAWSMAELIKLKAFQEGKYPLNQISQSAEKVLCQFDVLFYIQSPIAS